MEKVIFIVENAPEGGYVARALGTPMSAKAESLLELRDRAFEVARRYLGPCGDDRIGFFDMSHTRAS